MLMECLSHSSIDQRYSKCIDVLVNKFIIITAMIIKINMPMGSMILVLLYEVS